MIPHAGFRRPRDLALLAAVSVVALLVALAVPVSTEAAPAAGMAAVDVPTAPAAASWTPAGTPLTTRLRPSATLLNNGKVLVVGGTHAGTILNTAELYDPATNSWSATGSMAQARTWHTATLLPNGKVLVAGGYNGSHLSGAELYDPLTGTWSPAAGMGTARQNHTATLLGNGKVLVTGGDNTGLNPKLTQLYDPLAGTWSFSGFMSSSRYDHTATLLPNGKVLIAGGRNMSVLGQGTILSSTDLYDPGPGTWSITGGMNAGRQLHTASLLANGKVLVTAGQGPGYLATTEIYDPNPGTWSLTGSLSVGRSFHTATVLASGKAIVVGGRGYAGTLPGAELYDPDSGVWSATGSPQDTRDMHTATSLAGGRVVLIAGGYRLAFGEVGSAERYDERGGRGFGITHDPSSTWVTLSWLGGDIQAGYVLLRFNMDSGTTTELGPIGGSALTFNDSGAFSETVYCYVLVPFDGGGNMLGLSDLVCWVPNSNTLTFAFTTRLNQSNIASLNWTAVAGADNYTLWAVPLDGSAPRERLIRDVNATDNTGGVNTCYYVVPVQGGSPMGQSTMECAFPGVSTMSSAGSTASLHDVAAAALQVAQVRQADPHAAAPRWK